MEQKRLLALVSYAGGASEVRYALDLCCGLRSEGWSVTAYTRDMQAVDSLFQAAGIDLRHAPMQGLTDYGTIRNLATHLSRESRGSVILAQTFRTAFIGLCARKLASRPDLRVVMVSHRVRPPRNTFISRRVYRNLSSLIFSSVYARDTFAQAWKPGHMPAAGERLHVVRNSLFNPPGTIPEPASGPRVMLYNGAIFPGCGLENLVETLADLRGKRIRLLIGGRGSSDYVDMLRRLALNRGVMDLISWQTGGAAADLVARSHFSVYPYSAPDAFGYANIHTMAAGRPQIVTATRIAAEYLGHTGAALYIPPSDNEALRNAILTLADNPQLRAESGAAARSRYDSHLSWPSFIARTEPLLLVPDPASGR